MNGTIESKLRGTMWVLFAALALASAGCAQSSTPEEASDESDATDTAHQHLTPLPHKLPPLGGVPLPDNGAGQDGDEQDPTPIPWVPVTDTDDGDDGTPEPGDNPFTHSMSTPSSGHHDH